MSEARFSVVIPTREGRDTLLYTLETCLAQDFDDYEIIVGDNFSGPETGEVVRRIKSDKVKYFRTAEPLSMCDSWEAALARASGEYVLIIGDDDGLLPRALSRIDGLIEKLGVDVLRWERAYYSWPSIATLPGLSALANKVHLPLHNENRFLRAADIIPAVANCQADYTLLPMLYNAAVSRDLIDELRSRTGRVFGSVSPDIYSGFALAYLAGEYASTGYPMGINGGSAKSNGIAHTVLKGENPITKDFSDLNARSGISHHKKAPDVRVMPAVIAESFYQARDRLFPGDAGLDIDRRQLIGNCIRALRPESREALEAQLRALRASLDDDEGLLKWFDAAGHDARVEIGPARESQWKGGIIGDRLHLDAGDFDAHDVYSIAGLCGRILGDMEGLTDWPARPPEKAEKGPGPEGIGARLRKMINI